MKKLLTLLLALCGLTSLMSQTPGMSPDRKLLYAQGIIEGYYVDTVNSDKLVEEAIVAMLKTLDPHSSYSNAEETRELTTPLQGNFSGIGIQFNMMNDTLYVIQTTSGGPSEKVGILAGDRIISANDTMLSGVRKPNSEIIKILRGPKGTVVNVKVKRAGSQKLIDFRIVRDDIPIYSVDAAFMADSSTGYIRISRFAEETADEVDAAMAKLRRQGMKNLILDVEENGGGYLGSAYLLASKFLGKGDLVVYTDGPRIEPYYFKVARDGDFLDGRLVVMVNQYSASASEILAGALQDNDRGLIVGRRTFGKGLVQRPFPFPDGSMIRLTVSRYYTPSGRCIQKPYVEGDRDAYGSDMLRRYNSGELMSADSVHFADSLRYRTLRNHRTVYGGGGIMPDLFVPVDTSYYSDYYRDLVAKGIINSFCMDYVDRHRGELNLLYPDEDSFMAGFRVTDEMLQGVVDRGTADEVAPDAEGLATSRAMIEAIIKGLVARDLFETGSYFRVVNLMSTAYRAALDLINDPQEYERLLSLGRQ